MNENTTTRPLDEIEDDGSLACLGLDTDRERKVFSCPAARQIDLVGKTFWVLDYFGNIEGKDGNKKYLFEIIPNLDDPSTEERKVWTGSPEIMHILDKLREQRNDCQGDAQCVWQLPRLDEIWRYKKSHT